MTSIDLSEFSKEELMTLRKQVDAALANYEAKKRAEARAAVEAVAREHGFTVSELTGGKTKEPVPAKYCHPENPAKTWSGRGRQPQWFKNALENGMSPEDMLISA